MVQLVQLLYNILIKYAEQHIVIKYACTIADGRRMKNDPEEQVV